MGCEQAPVGHWRWCLPLWVAFSLWAVSPKWALSEVSTQEAGGSQHSVCLRENRWRHWQQEGQKTPEGGGAPQV